MTEILDTMFDGPQAGLMIGAIIGIILISFLGFPDIIIIVTALGGWAVTSGLAGSILDALT